MIEEGSDQVRSPFLRTGHTDYDSLPELAQEIEDELTRLSGDYEPELVDPLLAQYDFQESMKEENPAYWKPAVHADLDVDDSTVEEYFEEVVEELSGNQNYTLVEDQCYVDPLTGMIPGVRVSIGDSEQINETITVDYDQGTETVNTVEEASQLIGELVPERSPATEVPVYRTEQNGTEISVQPDLSTGIFKTDLEVGHDSHSTEVWMPVANRDNAIMVSPPSNFSPGAEATSVSVSEPSFTGDPLMDAVAESLPEVLTYAGVQQNEVSGDAVEARNENPLDQDAYSIRINSDAWQKYKEMGDDNQQRIKDEVDKLALNPDTSPQAVKESGKLDQVGNTGKYILWEDHEGSETIELKNISDRKDTFQRGSDNNRT